MPLSPAAQADAPGGAIETRLARWLEIRRGEWLLLALLTFSAFATITSYYFLKPVSKSIFLAAFGVKSVPDSYLAVAACTAVIGTAYARLSRRLPLTLMLNGVLVLLAGLMVAFRLWLDVSVTGWVAWAFYIYVSTFGVLAPAMVWFAINHMLEPRQARRLLGYVGAGAIGGGIAGAYLARIVLEFTSEHDLLWGALAFFLMALVALDLALLRTPTRIRERRGARAETSGTFMLIVGHRYVRTLAILIAIIMTAASLAEYQFLWAVDTYVPAGKETAAYLATWYGNLNFICLPIQLLVTAPMLRRFGVGPALLVLPMAVFTISTGMAVVPILAFGTAMKVGEGALRYSVNKSAVELLYLPLPHWIKDRSKVFIDTVVDRTAKGFAGVLLKLMAQLGFGIRAVSAMTAGLALLWIVLSLVMRRRHVSAFREALDRGTVDLDAHSVRLDDPAAVAAVEASLARETPAVEHTLDMLLAAPDAKVDRYVGRLAVLARSEDVDIAWRALELAARAPSPELVAIARERIGDPAARVAGAAAQVLLAVKPAPAAEFIAAIGPLAVGAEAHAAGALFAAGVDVSDDVIERLLHDASPPAANARRQLAVTLTGGGLPHRRALVRRLMADADVDVATAALAGAGSLGDPELVPFLLTEIRLATRRHAAREGLVRMGTKVLPLLEQHLSDPRVEMAVRTRIPRAIATIGGPQAHQALTRALSMDEPYMRHRVLKALNRMAHEKPGYPLPDSVVEAQLVGECHYLATLLAIASERGGGGRMRPLFDRALSDSIRHARERAFRLLGLRGAGRDWANAFAGLTNNDARLRASAVEFTDGALPDRLRRIVVPLIDDIGASEALHRVGRHLQVETLTREEAYARAARSREPWLAACALAAASEEGVESALDVARHRMEDGDPWVRDAAALAVARATGAGGGSAGPRGGDRADMDQRNHHEGTPLVERVILLSRVPLFAEARTSDLAHLAAAMHERRLDAGEVVHQAGDVPDAMNVIVSGRMRFERAGRAPVETDQGAFGAFGLFDVEPRTWTATAAAPTRLLTIDRDAFVEVISDHVNVARGVLRALAGRLRRRADGKATAGDLEGVEMG